MIPVDLKTNPISIADSKEQCLYYFSSYEGMFEWLKVKLNKAEEKKDTGEIIASKALEWVGKEFNSGMKEQCCYFVRAVLSQAGLNVGVTQKPSDNFLPTGRGYANSLAGDDIGKKVFRKDLQPGDLVFFKNTYGDYPEGTITHIGIYTGSGFFIHRPTSSRPVEKVVLDNYYSGIKFLEGRRLS
jgi:hypothetical protein